MPCAGRRNVLPLMSAVTVLLLAPALARSATDKPTVPSRSSRSQARPVASKSLGQKLQEIQARQQEILAKLDELLIELQHIKTRVTIR